MSREIILKNETHVATFVIDDTPDCGICQLVELDKENQVTNVTNWVTREYFITNTKQMRSVIKELKTQLEEKNKEILELKGEQNEYRN